MPGSADGDFPLLALHWPAINPLQIEIGFRSLLAPTGTVLRRGVDMQIIAVDVKPSGAGQNPEELREYYKRNKHKWHDYRKKKPGD